MAPIESNVATFLRTNWQTVLSLTLMGIAILVGIPVVLGLKREVSEDEGPITTADVLSEIEQAHAEGELDDAELKRVRELLKDPESPPPGRKRPAARGLVPGAPTDPEGGVPSPPADPTGSAGPS